jgi:hypothetical protein
LNTLINSDSGNESKGKCFRILSPTAILGYGFPLDSFEKGLEEKIDLIAVDAGSIDAGPYYLGSDKHYVGLVSLRRDLTYMLRAALEQNCLCIIGSAGFSGANPQCDEVVEIVRDIIAVESDRSVKLSVIHADINSADLSSKLNQLTPLGSMPPLNETHIKESKIVGQMGIEPIMTALALGAEVVVCGRAYDPAVFAAAPIAAGFEPGLCYHVGKILECGAIAAVPGSGSDCLIAEIYTDNHAEIFTPNPIRQCTPVSIAAHSLYEKSRPDFFYLPGGILDISQTEFYELDNRRVGIKGSRFISQALSIKLEGSRALGQRTISLLAVDKTQMPTSENSTEDEWRVYGKNGVEASLDNQELGLIVCVNSSNKDAARDVLAALRSGLLHYGYPGRISTAGNLAFPCSPSDLMLEQKNQASCFFIAGTRDPIFQSQWTAIQSGLLEQVSSQLPELIKQCTINFHNTDNKTGFVFIETCEDDVRHDAQLESLNASRIEGGVALEKIDAGLAYEWTLYHLLSDSVLLNACFGVQQWIWENGDWYKKDSCLCDWGKSLHMPGEKPDESIGHILQLPVNEKPQYGLKDIAEIIRSKNAGINEITYDVLFKTTEDFNYALNSGVFFSTEISNVLQVPESEIIGCYSYPAARAIKITARRKELAGNPGDRDVFGAQQHMALLALKL